MKLNLTTLIMLLFFSILLQPDSAFAAGGGVAPGFGAAHWIARLHIFLISFALMTGGSVMYYFLLRVKKTKKQK